MKRKPDYERLIPLNFYGNFSTKIVLISFSFIKQELSSLANRLKGAHILKTKKRQIIYDTF